MNKLKYIFRFLTAIVCAGVLHSCHIEYFDDEDCDYTVRLRYDYNFENESDVNLLSDYVFSLDEYLFDEAGVLQGIHPLALDECDNTWQSDLDLLPGKYSIIAIGNRSEMSVINEAVVGQTRREDMLMTLDVSRTRATTGSAGNTDKLYYGYRTFSIEQNKVTNVRVDMVHQHFSLRYRVRWETNTPNGGDYVAKLEGVPSHYAVMPQYVYPEINQCEDYDCDAHDLFALQPTWVKHHICRVSLTDNVMDHAQNGYINMSAEVNGHFITYRHRNDTHATFRLYRRTGAGELTPVMKAIDLSAHLTHPAIGVDLDRTLKQEYAIEFIIKSNGQVEVNFIDIADWDEGGAIG